MTRYAQELAALVLSGLLMASSALAQNASPAEAPTPAANPARDLLQSKCLQCHNDGIWRDQRQDARAWEATLYRMMGRGAVWSFDDIKTMASYLAADFGPNVARARRSAPQ
jgi:hypothetical protein